MYGQDSTMHLSKILGEGYSFLCKVRKRHIPVRVILKPNIKLGGVYKILSSRLILVLEMPWNPV